MKRFFLNDAVDLVSLGTKSVNSDSFTKFFSPVSALEMHHSGVLYIFSLFIRYLILFPLRFIFFSLGTVLFIFLFLLGILLKRERIIACSFLLYCNIFLYSFGARVRHHGKKEFLRTPHVFVANHTSFLDFIVLSSYKFCHASVAENHSGLFGFFLKHVLLRNGSLYFKRSEKNDKIIVKGKILQHIHEHRTPLLLFPEGTCVNNKYTVMFQKGVFETNAAICPVAIRYKRTLFDPYWNRRRHTFTEHVLYLMSRWMIEVDVFWMDPVKRRADESVFDFIDRVKTAISDKAGLVSLKWNGYMKNKIIVKDIEILRTAFKQTYLNIIDQNAQKKVTENVIIKNFSSTDIDKKCKTKIVKRVRNRRRNSVYQGQEKSAKQEAELNARKKEERCKNEARVSKNPSLIYFDTIDYGSFIKSVLSKYSWIRFMNTGGKCNNFENFPEKTMKVGCSCNKNKILKNMKFASGMCRKEV